MNRRDFLRTAGVLGAAAIVPLADELEDIARRMQRLAASNVDDATLSQLERMVDGLGRQYEVSDATAVYPAALRQRRWVDELLAGQQHPRQRAHLYGIAGKLSGLLGYLAFDRGNGLAARAYCDEAFTLAQTAGHRGLAAWIRGTKASSPTMTAITGRPSSWPGTGNATPPAARTASASPSPAKPAHWAASVTGPVSTTPSTAPSPPAAGWTRPTRSATSCPSTPTPPPALPATPPPPTSPSTPPASPPPPASTPNRPSTSSPPPPQSTASHALTLVDLATTHLAGPSPEPDHAGTLAADALTIGAQMHSEVVTRRTAAFLAAARRWHDVPEIAAFADATHDQQQPKALPAR